MAAAHANSIASREGPAELRRSLPRVACSGPGVGLELLTGDALFPPVATREGATAGLLFSVPPAAPSEAERVFVLSIAGARRSLYIAISRTPTSCRTALDGDFSPMPRGGERSDPHQWSANRCRRDSVGGHAKSFVVDGAWSSVGTVNFDNRRRR
jgi:phosphatidylserine/phosphatidylglycerophosphate/cardiolipin synthase-like enzyme